jgi:putative ABC transport system substrate-binding protein
MRQSIRRSISAAALLLALLIALAARGAPPERLFGVLLWHDSPNDLETLTGIERAVGALPGENRLLVRRADSHRDAAIRLLEGFRAENVDLVFSLGTDATLIARDTVRDVPVVFSAVTNPVESGIVPSWDGSGSNLAGNSNWIRPDAVLRVFRLAVPKLSRLGILRSKTTGVVSAAELSAMRKRIADPKAEPLEIIEEAIGDATDIAFAIARLADAKVDAVWIPIDFLIYENMPAILEAARARALPLVSSSLRGAQRGAVAGVHVDYAVLGEKAVALARRILDDGLSPGTIPVETLFDYRVVANLAAARRCGYDLPLGFLVQADLVIDDVPSETAPAPGATREKK